MKAIHGIGCARLILSLSLLTMGACTGGPDMPRNVIIGAGAGAAAGAIAGAGIGTAVGALAGAAIGAISTSDAFHQ
jgi:hypothetical protein